VADIFTNARILVVDDEAIVREFFMEALTRREAETLTANDGVQARDLLESTPVDLVITDLKMPNMDGMKLLQHIMGCHPLVPVIILTAFGTVDNAVEAMRLGAFDYICKPITDLAQLELALSRALQHRRLLVENRQLLGELTHRYRFDRLVGSSPNMRRIFELLATVAPTPTTVLVQGDSGTGKELVARAIHFNSPRARAPFIKVNCAALPEGLMESELFGHEKGAFTGAIRTTQGKFEAAANGTLLLDEISELPLGLQAKMLRVLQEREIQRVGSNDSLRVDVRVIATTNVDLEKAVKENRFRQDLFYRLNVIPIKIPTLSKRREDIPMLSYHFLSRFNKLHGRKVEKISDEAMRYLASAPWPGNVRELENTIERAVVLCPGDQIELAHFFLTDEPPVLPVLPTAAAPSAPSLTVGGMMTLYELEKQHILTTLKAYDGQRHRTAELLGISVRTLRNKLNEYRQAGESV
jgi:DNA-binding NtrC family response regulator